MSTGRPIVRIQADDRNRSPFRIMIGDYEVMRCHSLKGAKHWKMKVERIITTYEQIKRTEQ